MNLIILVSNLKEISASVFSWKKKEYIKKYDAILLLKYDSTRKKTTKLCFRVEKWSRSVKHLFLIFTQSWILLFVSFSYRIRQCFRSSTIRFVPYAFFINNQFRTCADAFPNEFTVRSYEYCPGRHWIFYWIQENKTATYFLRSRLFTCDIMKNFNCN